MSTPPAPAAAGPYRQCLAALLLAALTLVGLALPAAAQSSKPASATALSGRLIVGYQGWFGCPDDAPGNTQWEHWFYKNNPRVDDLAVDLLPAIGQFRNEDLCPTNLRRDDGTPDPPRS